MNELQTATNCILCVAANLFIPAMGWAIMIAGLTWIVRDTTQTEDRKRCSEKDQTDSCGLCSRL